MKMHYTRQIGARGRGVTACGRVVGTHQRTNNLSQVTCSRCMGTWAYRADRRTGDAGTPVLNEAGPLTAQQALDKAFTALHKWANENSYCSTYDEAVDYARSALDGTGLTISERKSFEVYVHEREMVGFSTREEARVHLIEHLDDYIGLVES